MSFDYHIGRAIFWSILIFACRQCPSLQLFAPSSRTLQALTYASSLQEDLQKLSDVQALVGQLYEAFHVREYNADMERAIIAELENVRLQLEPLEQVKMFG